MLVSQILSVSVPVLTQLNLLRHPVLKLWGESWHDQQKEGVEKDLIGLKCINSTRLLPTQFSLEKKRVRDETIFCSCQNARGCIILMLIY